MTILLGNKMLDLKNNTISLDLFKRVIREIKNNPDRSLDIIDSFSNNQFLEKGKLLEAIDQLDILNLDSEVVIFGSWYGSILIPILASKVKRVTCIDLDDRVLRIAKNNLFQDYKNIDYIGADMFEKDRERYWRTALFINTSCEHMPAMKEWPYWSNISKGAHFAFISNNMYYISGHTNCVSSIEEFKNQLPDNSTVLVEDEIVEERGTKYMLIGKI
jgi:hypothetical protein